MLAAEWATLLAEWVTAPECVLAVSSAAVDRLAIVEASRSDRALSDRDAVRRLLAAVLITVAAGS
jgi:hypothetical protein